MAMTIQEFYNSVYSNEQTKNPDVFISLIEKNMELLENQNIQDVELYYMVMRLTSDYANFLKSKESYSKALPYLDRAIILHENYEDIDESKLNEIEFYRILRFDRGVSNFYVKEYSKAQLDFEWLIRYNPDNDIYKSWICGLKSRKYDFTLKILFYIVIGAMLFVSFFDRKTNAFIHDLILYVGTIGLIVALILESIKYINKRKTKIWNKKINKNPSL